jgi:hypothetical protein
MVESTRVGRRGQAAAAVIQCCQRARGVREESEGARLGQLTDADPSRFGLTKPGGPVGPIGPNGPGPFV